MMVYHVVSDLEHHFNSLSESLKACRQPFYPKIPTNKSPEEDSTTPRICVARSVEECLSGISLLGVFRRCLAANEDAKSYATHGREVYPIIVVAFDVHSNSLYKPTPVQVADADLTGELWLLR